MLYGPGYNPWLRNATDGERSEDIFRIWTESHGPNTECNISFPILSRFAVKIRGLSLILAHSSPPTQCIHAIQEISIKKNFFKLIKLGFLWQAGGRANKSKVKAP